MQGSELDGMGWPMRAWAKSTERLLGVSARLLAVASVLSSIGLGLAIRQAWQQTGQSFGPDGATADFGVPFTHRLTMVMLDLSYRQVGTPLLLSSALVGAAVLALHRNPSWARVRLVRWEVLGAGILALAIAAGLVLVNLYVMASPDEATEDSAYYMGPQPLTELIIGNVPTLVASVLTLAVAGLWWLRLEPVADDDPDGDSDDDPADEPGDDLDASVEQETVASLPVPPQAARDSSDPLGNGAAMGYPQDWSPEDFRRPS